MQEKVYQTYIANIDELKHRLVRAWAELDHRHIAAAVRQRRCRLNECDSCVKAKGDILTNISVNFFASYLHVALWAICWIFVLCNIWHLTLLAADFDCLVSYYSRSCAFCVWYVFNSSYYHIHKVNLCKYVLHLVMRELCLNKILQKFLKYLNRWRSYGEN